MRIDEFVNTYTAIELDKINERKSERSKPGRKALMGRVLDNIIGDKCTSKDVSNEQATRILQDAFTSSSGFSKCLVAPRRNSGARLSRSKTFRDS